MSSTYDIVCHDLRCRTYDVVGHDLRYPKLRCRPILRHRMSWHTISYALIVCSLHHIAYDIVGHYIRCSMLTLYVLGTTSCAISHTMSRTMFHLIQIVRAKLPARSLWDSIEQTSVFIAMHNTRFRPGTPPQRPMPPRQRRPRRQRRCLQQPSTLRPRRWLQHYLLLFRRHTHREFFFAIRLYNRNDSHLDMSDL